MSQTNVDRALEALEEQFADDPERASVIRSTRRFKASWIELAERLSDVKRRRSYERWGYSAFDTYANEELKLRPETVEKLTGSYVFLRSHAPEVLRRDPLEARIPSYQSIEFLRRAEERAEQDGHVPEATMNDLRKRVLEDAAPLASVSRIYKDTVFPISDGERRELQQQQLKRAALRLRELLESTSAVSRRLAGDVSEAVGRLLAELEAGAKAA